MKKLSYVMLLSIVSIVLFSCQEEIVQPTDTDATEEVALNDQESTEGGNDPDTDGGVKD